MTNKERVQRDIRRAVRRPRGLAITIRAHIAKRRTGEEFSVVTVNFPKVIPTNLWHSYSRRRRFLDESHALLRHLVYQINRSSR